MMLSPTPSSAFLHPMDVSTKVSHFELGLGLGFTLGCLFWFGFCLLTICREHYRKPAFGQPRPNQPQFEPPPPYEEDQPQPQRYNEAPNNGSDEPTAGQDPSGGDPLWAVIAYEGSAEQGVRLRVQHFARPGQVTRVYDSGNVTEYDFPANRQ